ncbi:thioredoxin-2-like, partial [Sitodiplosis mosellana]|uniref:thioredoxin-2-like n=1 Tax=Sitodiplosis mosellana TaxID=263140 RepID=UPI002444DFC7
MKFALCLFLACLSVSYASSNNWKDITTRRELLREVRDAEDKLMVVEFHYTWCGFTTNIESALNKSALKYPDVVFLKVDIEKSERLRRRYRVTASPTFIYFKNGKKLTKFADANVSRFESVLNQYSNNEQLQQLNSTSTLEYNSRRELRLSQTTCYWRHTEIHLICIVHVSGRSSNYQITTTNYTDRRIPRFT